MAIRLNNNQIYATSIDGSYAANLGGVKKTYTPPLATQDTINAARLKTLKAQIQPPAGLDLSYGGNIPTALNINSDLVVKNAGSPTGTSFVSTSGNGATSTPKTPTASETPAANTGATVEQTTSEPAQPLTYDSYLEYLLKLKDDPSATTEDLRAALLAYDNLYAEHLGESERTAAEAQRAEAERQAEIARQRSIVDANSSYAQNLSAYGSNAERLASMGLTGSGYGEYLSAQAYAQKVGAQAAADAQADQTKSAASYNEYLAKLAADQKEASIKQSAVSSYIKDTADYRDKKATEEKAAAEQAERERKEAFNGLLSYAKQGGYTDDEIAKLGTDYNLSDDEIAMLKAAAQEYNTKKYETNNSKLLAQIANNETNKQLIDAALNSGEISKEQHKSLIEAYQKKKYDGYLGELKGNSGTYFDTNEIDTAYRNGEISAEQYNSIKSEWNKSIDAKSLFSGSNFANDTLLYNSVKNSGWASSDTLNALNNAYYATCGKDIAKNYASQWGIDSGDIGGKTVNIYADNYGASQWGDFNGITDSSDAQGKYAAQIVADAKAGKIAVGKVVKMNYGLVASDHGYYVYIGNGVFVKIDKSTRGAYKDKTYLPSDYKWGSLDKVKEA